jgi:uncharacterized protein (TIGR02246 family)
MSVRAAIEALASQWVRAFNARELKTLAQLYTDDAMFIGAAGMRRGPAAILDYVQAHGANLALTFDELHVELLDCDVALAALAGTATDDGAQARGFRFLLTYLWTPKGWRIAGHHGSYEAAPVG